MKTYYHTSVMCPECLRPFSEKDLEKAEYVLTKDENTGYYSCNICNPECNIEFSENVKLDEYKNIDVPFHDKGSPYFPLYRRVILNEVEKDYIEWLSGSISGIHLITWPWKDVRFLPVALTEYILHHMEHKIVVLNNSENPDVCDLENRISKLFSLDINPDDHNSGIKIRKQDLESSIFHMRNVVEVKIRKIGEKYTSPKKYTTTASKTKKRNDIITELISEYNENAAGIIRSISGSLPPNKKYLINKDTGKYDITLEKKTQKSGKVLRYKKAWMEEVLGNHGDVIFSTDILKPITEDHFDFVAYERDTGSKLYISNVDIGTKEDDEIKRIFGSIKNLKPDILIITNMDSYIQDIRYGGYKSGILLDYLNSTKIPVILFSTDPESRQYYGLDKNNNKFSSINITIHPLDSSLVLKSYNNDISRNKPDAYSSGSLPTDKMQKVHIEYIEYVNGLYPLLMEYSSYKNKKFWDICRFFIRNLTSSPLNVIDDSRYQLFTAIKDHEAYNYERLHSIIEEHATEIGEEFRYGFNNLMYTYYISDENTPKNPLRDKFYEILTNITNKDENAQIILIVSPFECNGFQKIINESEEISQLILKVSSWNKLGRDLNNIDMSKGKIYIISSRYPSMGYKLTDSPVFKFIFINDSYGIEQIKKIIDKRLLDSITRPIIYPKDTAQLPQHLNDILRDTIFENSEELIEECYQDEEGELYYYKNNSYKSSENDSDELNDNVEPIRKTIPKGSCAVLCIDKDGRGLFIPLDISIMIIKDEFFEDVKTDSKIKDLEKNLKKSLKDKYILIGKNNLYSSFRGIFFRYMVENQNKISRNDTLYQWSSYKEMYFDSTAWIRYILAAIENIHKSGNLSLDDAHKFVCGKLSRSDLTAKEINTINLWLKPIDSVNIGGISYDLYRTERPFNRSDVTIIKEILLEYVPNNNLFDLEKSFVAALTIQNIRNKVLNANNNFDDKMIFRIYEGLKKERVKILKNAEIFHPNYVSLVYLERDVNALKIIRNYKEFISIRNDNFS